MSTPNQLNVFLRENISLSQDQAQSLIQITQFLRSISRSVNSKEIGTYFDQEVLNGQQFFSTKPASEPQVTRDVYRTVIDFGALPNTGTKTVAHNITNINTQFSITRLYGATSDTTSFEYRSLPWAANPSTNTIELSMDATNIIVKTFIDLTRFNKTYVVVEYMRNLT
ncbi:MAG TPA: hypothetical protein VMW91_00610 [Desulfosporosinus sp.]|nr:hypothetical protein [Desulfosporosinus sp.]